MLKTSRLLLAFIFLSVLMGVSGCNDGLVYENEKDCSTKIKFVFAKHRHALQSITDKGTDVFPATVPSVHLFIYDEESGRLLMDVFKNADELSSEADLGIGVGNEKCYLPLDLDPGNYKFIAWCGLNEYDRNNAFTLNDTKSNFAPECFVEKDINGFPLSSEQYESVYHGSTIKNIESRNLGGELITIELTKNNNDINVWVQHTTSTFEVDDYKVVYIDGNGSMDFFTNSLSNTTSLQYNSYSASLMEVDSEFNGDIVKTGALVSHLSTSRLLSSNAATSKLQIRNKEDKVIFSVPFIQYVLEMQTFTQDHQYYLDCEDTYNCSFYFSGEDSNGLWMPVRIVINNWVKVPDQQESF